MIIWINGAFGSGKSSVAESLNAKIPNSFIYDPENVGTLLRHNIPKEMSHADYQDYPLWRDLNLFLLKDIHKNYNGTLIVPMTLTRPDYFDEIIGKLRDSAIEVKHFILLASKETILERLADRGDDRESWPARQIDRCVKAFGHEINGICIDTEGKGIVEITDEILHLIV